MITILYLIATRKARPSMTWILGGLITLLVDTVILFYITT